MRTFVTDRHRPVAVVAAALIIATAFLAVLAASSTGAPAGGSADLSVTKTDLKDPVRPGAPIDYKIAVTNAGPDTAVGVVVTDSLPPGATYVSATSTSGACSAKGKKVTCNLGDLASGQGASVALRVTAPAKAGTIDNRVDVSSATPDPVKANDSASQSTVIAGRVPTCFGKPATIVGTGAGEKLRGTTGRDVIFAAGGADEVRGLGGKDMICGAGGKDLVKGGADDDRLAGAGGRDKLAGGGGDDLVKGGKRADRLRGGVGADTLRGGKGNDRCTGGPGKDVTRSC